ncbi:hypothetical protein V6N11_071321 [Hibiscus sabdariffa]|uniref:Uncharacterized protein n=1 Tax=Hibiscus sabdariffa TaxID=183260 RepID=A0ABR2U0K5_9ROSI
MSSSLVLAEASGCNSNFVPALNVGSLGVKSMSVIRPHVVAQCSAMDPDVVDTLSLLAPMFVESTAQLPSPEGEVLGSRLTNNPSGQRQPLTPREQAGRDRRGVGVGGLQPC